jgi:excisionase family DNA binding protein
MENFSTRQTAKLLGISASTLSRYLAAGKIPAPKALQVGGKTVHLWTGREIERVRKLLPNIEDGRTTRHRKQARKDTTPTS